jgi:glutathione S-transferase
MPPSWFERISPLGKVPLLLVREKEGDEPVVLFESAVVNEYMDEVTPPSIQQKNPLKKAGERAWIEASGELLGLTYPLMVSSDLTEIQEAVEDVWRILGQVEAVLPGGRFFRGTEFSLVDAAFAPLFQRLLLMKPIREDSHWKKLPKTREWATALLKLPEVQDSTIPEFNAKFAAFLKKMGSAWSDQLIF